MQEPALSLNNFGMPKVYENTDAMYLNLIRLILLEKGKNQSHPDMGVDIRRRYRFNNDENVLQNLQRDIANQIERFIPELSVLDVSVTLKSNTVGIIVNTNDGAYVLGYNMNNGNIDPSANYVLEDL